METETCTNCLATLILDEDNNMWLHVITNEPECDPEDSPGTVGEPRY
ncbi:hypothetical protein SEA_KABOCHA_110 [Gordonia phage Kabocha]|uniref:Uncharacterized protein n=1 Tax=Gordonia phage Chidiebere TaxID=2656530 RepID=A0A649VKS2_9CAUD|nr:hypothetical protein PQD14_gp109 [Gordonia phage Chidiebere]QGJ92996.1 hypothetical protein PBI_CHIDIEBERE_109 [Gordonia phage Chidiebere]WAA19896.1 hypothetical protein SEA_KABOCHA_110 [Gordonia phage Kabocha]WAA20085.1 hypothetical protein SEA_HANEM_108 [Gordonia phage Hanem]WNM67128.1 hypothetical protein SEA_SCHOMBER_107 [Gordonia Phage Schomber]